MLGFYILHTRIHVYAFVCQFVCSKSVRSRSTTFLAWSYWLLAALLSGLEIAFAAVAVALAAAPAPAVFVFVDFVVLVAMVQRFIGIFEVITTLIAAKLHIPRRVVRAWLLVAASRVTAVPNTPSSSNEFPNLFTISCNIYHNTTAALSIGRDC